MKREEVQVAGEELFAPFRLGLGTTQGLQYLVEEAILTAYERGVREERERCAKIAEVDFDGDEFPQEQIADRIRKGGEQDAHSGRDLLSEPMDAAMRVRR